MYSPGQLAVHAGLGELPFELPGFAWVGRAPTGRCVEQNEVGASVRGVAHQRQQGSSAIIQVGCMRHTFGLPPGVSQMPDVGLTQRSMKGTFGVDLKGKGRGGGAGRHSDARRLLPCTDSMHSMLHRCCTTSTASLSTRGSCRTSAPTAGWTASARRLQSRSRGWPGDQLVACGAMHSGRADGGGLGPRVYACVHVLQQRQQHAHICGYSRMHRQDSPSARLPAHHACHVEALNDSMCGHMQVH